MKLHYTIGRMLCLAFALIYVQAEAQVTIGHSSEPNRGSLLDLKQNDSINDNSSKGLLLPRVALEDVVKMGPCIQSDLAQDEDKKAHVGLTVYNITDSLSVGLCPGIYIWDGTTWIRLPEPCKSTAVDPELLYSPNCYIVEPGQDSEEIPIAKAYLVSESRSDLTDLNRSDKVSVKVLWQDTESLIDKVELIDGDKGIYSKFKVTTKGTAQGNALVALHVGPLGTDADPIAWSWHIWVTDYDPNGGTTYPHNNGEKDYVFMDRNIGALNTTPTNVNSMGLMYQWGRKDPFTSAAGNWTHEVRDLYSHPSNTVLNEINEVLPNGNTQPSGSGIKHVIPPSGTSNLQISIQSPMTFFAGDYIRNDYNYVFDWYSGDSIGTPNNNELWGTSTQKSPFDPCPAGWRVPSYATNNSPWYPYLDTGGWGSWGGIAGFNIVGSNGFNFVGTSSRSALGYYPACFARAPRAFFTGGSVGSSNEYPTSAGGSFLVIGYGTAGMQDQIEGYYWTSSFSDNRKAKMMSITIDVMGEPQINEGLSPKAKGAYVRCVKE